MISDKYAIIRKIATTEHTSVFLVRHIQLDSLRIAKVVSKQVPDYLRVYREAMLIKDLKFDGLPIIYDIEEDNISICIIEEYIAGKSLDEYIQENGPLSLYDAVDISISVCNIIEYLHNKALMAHLDIKPDNIIIHEEVTHKGKRLVVHLIDFDSSRRNDNQYMSSYGTIGYAAPEQFFGEGNPLSDIYSIGILIAYMVDDNHEQSIQDDIHRVCRLNSKSVGPVIERCLRHNQNQRYQSIDQLRKDLLRIQKPMLKHINNTAHNADKSLIDVYVSGTRHGIGTTHFCLCMASFLARRGKKVVIIRHGDVHDLKSEKILDNLHGSVALYSGIMIRPEYSGCVSEDYCDCTYHIHDFGTDRKKRKNGINILVGDCGYRRSDYVAMEKSDKDTIIFINHVSGHDFYRYIRRYGGGHRHYRFPCMYRWNVENRLFEEAMLEIFEFSKKKAWFGR